MNSVGDQNQSCCLRYIFRALCLGTLLLLATTATAQRNCIPVDLTQVASTDLDETIEAIGTLEARQEVILKPELSGIIDEVHFEEGNAVEQGQLLFSIEDDTYQAQLRAKEALLQQHRAQLSNQRRNFERRKRLFQQQQVSEEVRDEAETQLKIAQAQVRRLQAEIDEFREVLEDTRIRAPFAGIVGELLVDPGNWVDAGTPLAAVTQNDPLHIAFTLPEKSSGRVQTGQLARVLIPAYPKKHFEGRVFFISPRIESSSRSLLVKAILDNSRQELKPGGFASVQLKVGTRRNVPVIPEEALIPTRTGYMVFTVQDEQAHARQVEIGLRRPGTVEIRSGLEAGETVIRAGHESVQEDDRVCPAKPKQAKE